MNRTFSHGGTVLSLARQLAVPPEAIVDFSASINPLGPPTGVRKAAIAALRLVGNYPEASSPALCAALAEYHSIPVETVAAANGSTELIHLVPRLFRRAAGRALLIAPTFSEYANALQLAGWKLDYLTLSHENGFELDCNRVAEELAKGYDLLFFCNPGNPTGRLYSYDDIETLYRLCRSCGCFFVLDEAFMDFAGGSLAKLLIPTADSGLVLRSLTKFFGFPGIRVGYAIASPEVTKRLQRFLPPWNLGVVSQAAALAALKPSAYGARTLTFIARERRWLANALRKIPGLTVFEGSANYLLIRLDCGMTAGELQLKLLPQLLMIRDCSSFEGLDPRFFRIAVKGRPANKKLLQAIAVVLNTSG